MNKKVTIGLCVKNGAKVVKTAFNSISIQDYPHELVKLVIVDNGSSDSTLSLALDFAKKTDIKTFVTSSEGKGLAETRQLAADNAEGDYILWVDDDHVLSKDFLRNMVEFMEKNKEVGAAAGINTQVVSNAKINSIAAYMGARNLQSSNKTKIVGSGGSIYRLKALEDIGGFDIQIKGALEDVDVSQRMRALGWRLAVNNSSQVYYKHPPSTLKALWKKNFWYGYGNHFYFHKYKDQWSIEGYFPPLVLWGGLKMSYITYRLTASKRVFVFPILFAFSMIAHYIGFNRAHLNGYGHSNDTVKVKILRCSLK